MSCVYSTVRSLKVQVGVGCYTSPESNRRPRDSPIFLTTEKQLEHA
jgi:hypothetical protein